MFPPRAPFFLAGLAARSHGSNSLPSDTARLSGDTGQAGVSARPSPGRKLDGMAIHEDVIEALREVEDPELGMDIVELGLLSEVEVTGANVKVIYTLTSMGCPAGAMIQEDIDRVTRGVPGVEQVETELTFEPPWTPDRMSDDAKFILGFG
jgi:metal-sulfur cluster biosynthetic enzyme